MSSPLIPAVVLLPLAAALFTARPLLAAEAPTPDVRSPDFAAEMVLRYQRWAGGGDAVLADVRDPRFADRVALRYTAWGDAAAPSPGAAAAPR